VPDNENGEQVRQLHFFLLNLAATSMNVGTTSCVDEASARSRNRRPPLIPKTFLFWGRIPGGGNRAA
ncbi:hypothetical protein ALC62_01709, partial [Cyphomyrmex costatus]